MTLGTLLIAPITYFLSQPHFSMFSLRNAPLSVLSGGPVDESEEIDVIKLYEESIEILG